MRDLVESRKQEQQDAVKKYRPRKRERTVRFRLNCTECRDDGIDGPRRVRRSKATRERGTPERLIRVGTYDESLSSFISIEF